MKSFDPSLTTKGESLLQLKCERSEHHKSEAPVAPFFLIRGTLINPRFARNQHCSTKVRVVTKIRYLINPYCKR